MCVIVYQKSGSYLDKARAQRLWKANSHGGGYAYINDDDEIIVDKSMLFGEFWRSFETARSANPGTDFLVHMRIKTHGPTDLANVHPFPVNEKTWMAHNGILGQMPDDPLRSDTRVFIDEVVKSMSPTWLDNAWQKDMMEEFIGWSKLAFLTTDPALEENVYLLNESAGEWVDGMWFSSPNGVKDYKPKAERKTTGSTSSPRESRFRQATPVSEAVDFDGWLGGSEDVLTPYAPGLAVNHEGQDLWKDYLLDERTKNGNVNRIVFRHKTKNWECLGCDEKVDGTSGECECWSKLCPTCQNFAVDCSCHNGFVRNPVWCDDCPDEMVNAAIQAYCDSTE